MANEWNADKTDPAAPFGKVQMTLKGPGSNLVLAFDTKTGRTVAGDEHARALEWAESSENQLTTHAGFKDFRDAMPALPLFTQPVLNAVRGRTFEPGNTIDSGCFGPPPKHARSGRYNSADEPVLYLCDSSDGVRREMQVTDGRELWAQRFRVPLTGLRVAHVSKLDTKDFVNSAFFFAESVLSPFTFSQLLAAMLSDSFDAMIVPGVRGEMNFHYSNIVLFRPHDLPWSSWLDGEPEALR